MRNISLKIIVCAAIIASISMYCCGISAFAQENSAVTSITNKEQAIIKDLMQDVNGAASSGDERLVAKLLLDAVKRNKPLAAKIIKIFLDNQGNSKVESTTSIDTAAIINSIVSNLQQRKGNEEVVASVLSSVMPAGGGGHLASNTPISSTLPATLPSAAQMSDSVDGLPNENPGRTASH